MGDRPLTFDRPLPAQRWVWVVVLAALGVLGALLAGSPEAGSAAGEGRADHHPP